MVEIKPNVKTGKRGTYTSFLEKFKSQKDKKLYSAHLLKFKRSKNRLETGEEQQKRKMVVLERRSLTSL